MKPFAVIFLSALLLQANIAAAQPGALDLSFGSNGTMRLHPNFTVDETKDMALTNDGKILLLSSNFHIGNYILRLNSDGTPDSTFGNAGKKILAAGGTIASAIEVDYLNRILVYSLYDNFYATSMYVSRFLEDGSKDLSFGNDGKIVTFISRGNRAMLLQADHKIVIAGRSSDEIADIARLNEDGSYDTGFSVNGLNILNTLNNSYIYSVAQQSDGKLLATGTADGKMFVARFTTAGDLDTNFDGDGIVTFSSTDILAGQAIAVLADEKIMVMGHRETATESSLISWKLLPDGTPDNTFGTGGMQTLYTSEENNFGWFVFSQTDSAAIAGATIFDGARYQPVLYRVLNDGTTDPAFSTNGTAGKTFDCGKSIQLNGAIDANGKILYAGTGLAGANNKVTVSRLLPDGQTDAAFGNNGTISLFTVDSVYSYDELEDFTVLADGKIFCAGTVYGEMVFFRLNSDGTPDTTYGDHGYYAPLTYSGASGIFYNGPAVIIASDGLMIYAVQQTFSSALGDEDLALPNLPTEIILHKFNADGTPDLSFVEEGPHKLAFDGYGQFYFGICDLKLMADGKLLFAGTRYVDFSPSEVFVARLKNDGMPDSTFASNGELHFLFNDDAYIIKTAIRPDGKINCVIPYYDGNNYEGFLSVSRLLADGSFDVYFAANGSEIIQTTFSEVAQLLLQQENQMLVLLTKGDNPSSALLQLYDGGTIDSSFADNGYLSSEELIYGQPGVQLQPDGKILFCNGTLTSGIATSRYLANGDTDLVFGVNGTASFPAVPLAGVIKRILHIQADGKILIGTTGGYDFLMARLLNDGAVATSERAKEDGWMVYPNPATDMLVIKNYSSAGSAGVFSITGITGRKVLEEKWEKENSTHYLSIHSLPAGIYTLKFQNEKEMITTRFIKQ